MKYIFFPYIVYHLFSFHVVSRTPSQPVLSLYNIWMYRWIQKMAHAVHIYAICHIWVLSKIWRTWVMQRGRMLEQAFSAFCKFSLLMQPTSSCWTLKMMGVYKTRFFFFSVHSEWAYVLSHLGVVPLICCCIFME